MIARDAVPQMSDKQYDRHFEIVERQRERNEKYHIHVLKRFFDIRRLPHPATLGSFSWSSLPIKTKWLNAPHAFNNGGGMVTPGDLARDYLSIKYPDRAIRCTTDQWQKSVSDRRQPPIYCNPCQLESAVYLDLSGAFWQIVRAVGWDVSYNPGKFLTSNSRMTDFPYPQNKMARNCLVSVGLPAPMRMWTGTEIKFVKKPSKFVNLILWRLVMDVLNSVAADMIDAGAVYVYTDGYILPYEKLDQAWSILESYGLEGRVKFEGEADVVTPACYAFTNERDGFRCTEIYRRRKTRARRLVSKFYGSERDFIKRKFTRLAKYAINEWEWMRQ